MLKRITAREAGSERLRVLLAVAALPVLSAYTAIAAVYAVVAALATQATFSPGGVLAAAAPGWLAAHQVPLTIGGYQLGLLPLAMTIGVGVLLARSAAGAAERLDCRTPQQAVVIIAAMAGAHAVTGVTVAVLANGGLVTADPLAAFWLPGLFAAVAACLGLARRCGLLAAVRPYTDDAAVAGVRAGLLGMASLLAGGAVVLTVASVASAPTMHALFEASAPGFGSGVGMLVLCVAYLPNAVLATLGFTVGPGFSFDGVQLSPFAFTGGDVPAVPLLAGMPSAPADWWRVFFVLPAVAGIVVGLRLRRSSPDPRQRLRSVGVAGAVVGFSCVVLGALAGGGIGAGDGLSLPLGWLSAAAFCWIAVPAALLAYFAGPRESRSEDRESRSDDRESRSDDGELAAEDGELAADDGELADAEPASEPQPEPEAADPAAESADSPASEANAPASAANSPASEANSPAPEAKSPEPAPEANSPEPEPEPEPEPKRDSRDGERDSREEPPEQGQG